MSALVLPNRRVEDWKYSDLRHAIEPGTIEAAPTARWSIASISGGVEQAELPEIVPHGKHGIMADLAIEAAKTGVFLRVAPGETGTVELQVSDNGHGRALIVVEAGASLALAEATTSDGFSNMAIDIVLGRGARLSHLRHSPACEQAVRVADYSLRIAKGGSYAAHFADFGARLSRTELHIALEGEGASAHLSGVGVLSGERHADVTTRIAHAHGQTESTQLFKIIAAGRSRGVYQGKISVAKHANGSDSRQTAKGLLLGERAEIDLKPELEILADDVKCAHGAAIGDLDLDSLFYLRARGVPETEARALLMRAFLGDAVERIADEAVRAQVWASVDAALRGLS